MLHLVRTLLAQREGATAIEYAFVTMLISIIFIAVIEIIGTQLSDAFQNVANGLLSANAS